MDKLLPKRFVVDDECALSHIGGENAKHLLVLCSVVKNIWDSFFPCFSRRGIMRLRLSMFVYLTLVNMESVELGKKTCELELREGKLTEVIKISEKFRQRERAGISVVQSGLR